MSDVNLVKEKNTTANPTTHLDSSQENVSSVSTVNPTSNHSGVSQDSKNMGLLIWLGCLFTGFVVPLILFIVKKEDNFVQSQSKEALNLCITTILAYIGAWIMAIFFGFIFAPLAFLAIFVMMIIGFGFFIFCILGAIKCANGDDFKVPFSIRLIK